MSSSVNEGNGDKGFVTTNLRMRSIAMGLLRVKNHRKLCTTSSLNQICFRVNIPLFKYDVKKTLINNCCETLNYLTLIGWIKFLYEQQEFEIRMPQKSSVIQDFFVQNIIFERSKFALNKKNLMKSSEECLNN